MILKDPARLQLRKKDGTVIYGYDQDWYNESWQRVSGCGPTAASLLAGYVLQRDGLLPYDARDTVAKRRRAMETMWDYVTPSHYGGLYKTEWFRSGLQKSLDAAAPFAYTVIMLPVYPFHICRNRADDILAFIAAGLSADSPVAFLNRSRGNETELSTWHWISIVELHDKQSGQAVCYDSGMTTHFFPTQWLQDAALGGGFVYVKQA